MVFQVSPGSGKSYIHAENAKTSGTGPLNKDLNLIFKFARVAKIFEKNREVQICTPPPAVRGLMQYQ